MTTTTTATTSRNRSPVEQWAGIGKGSKHRAWRKASREQAIRDSSAYIESGNALARVIREKSTWPFALDKKFVLRRIRRHHAKLAALRLAEAQELVALGMTYNQAFSPTAQKVEEFDPND